MDHVDEGVNDDDVFVYMGGLIPQHLRDTLIHVRVHKSVKIITRYAFYRCTNLVSIEMHDGVEIIEVGAFFDCWSLRAIKLTGVRVIEEEAFFGCVAMENVEFGDELETIGNWAFNHCTSLRNVEILKVRLIGVGAFARCDRLTEVELSEDLERIEADVFSNCRLRRIAIPLKDNLLQNNFVFRECDALSQVDLVGGIHETISSLLLDSWRNKMNAIIGQINQVLPNTPANDKTETIRRWMERVLRRIEHFKSEHYALLKNNMTQLELAVWKSGLSNIDAAAGRHEARVTCGADIIIPHVLSFLNDEEVFPTVRAIPL